MTSEKTHLTDDKIITCNSEDRVVLRELAKQIADIADLPVMEQRRKLWQQHNDMENVRPPVYIDPQGAWCELLPPLQCSTSFLKSIESYLRKRIYTFEHFASDNVVEKDWIVSKAINNSGWGLNVERQHSAEKRGAYGFSPVILGSEDLKKLKHPIITHDEDASEQRVAFFHDLFGDILNIKLKGLVDFSYHLMKQYSSLRGLEQTLFDMVENPSMIHDAMEFFTEGHQKILQQLQEQNLLSLNNDNTPIYTSGHGYTSHLPQSDSDTEKVYPADLWGWAEAQEMAATSPKMHEEFAFSYEKRLLEPFGLNGYGCCDDITHKFDFVLTIPNLRRVSVSPWADVKLCAEQLGDKAIFMWKPQPANLVGQFAPERIRSYLRHTIEVTKANDCILEIVLLDTHSCENHPERFDDWAKIAHEEADRIYTD